MYEFFLSLNGNKEKKAHKSDFYVIYKQHIINNQFLQQKLYLDSSILFIECQKNY